MAVALRERRAIRGEQVIAERPDGTRYWFESHSTPMFDADGKFTGGIDMLLDITERKEAERLAAEQSARIAAIAIQRDQAAEALRSNQQDLCDVLARQAADLIV